MVELVELSNKTHQQLRVLPHSKIDYAKGQQIMRIRVAEIGQAATDFPLIFSRNARDGSWVLGILTGLGKTLNTFIRNGTWMATFQPAAMQTYPLFLINSPSSDNAYTIGVDPNSDAFSQQSGQPLFDSQGAPSLYLSKVKAMLEASIKQDIETTKFIQSVERLDLFKPIDLNITYANDTNQKVTGLYVLDEAKMQNLSAEQLGELNSLGYLLPMHAMLVSLFQMNKLIRNNNEVDKTNAIKQLKMEVAKNQTGY